MLGRGGEGSRAGDVLIPLFFGRKRTGKEIGRDLRDLWAKLPNSRRPWVEEATADVSTRCSGHKTWDSGRFRGH